MNPIYLILAGIVGYAIGYLQAYANGKGSTIMSDQQWREFMRSKNPHFNESQRLKEAIRKHKEFTSKYDCATTEDNDLYATVEQEAIA